MYGIHIHHGYIPPVEPTSCLCINLCICMCIGALKSNVASLRHAVEQEHKNLFSSVSQQHTVVVTSSVDNQEPPHSDNGNYRTMEIHIYHSVVYNILLPIVQD